MHTKPLHQDLEAKAVSNNCIKVTIDEDLSIEGATIKVLGPSRLLILSITNPTHTMDICLNTGDPTFIELHTKDGSSVQYVKGSGVEFYKSLN